MTARGRAAGRAGRVLDLQEGRGAGPDPRRRRHRGMLRTSRRIAVVGASPDPGRPSYGVMRYLLHQGYECVPVNPNARDVLGHARVPDARRGGRRERARSTSSTSSGARSCASRTREEAVAVGARCLWLQLGRRQLGGRPDRGGRRARRRDGPLHGDRAPDPARRLTREVPAGTRLTTRALAGRRGAPELGHVEVEDELDLVAERDAVLAGPADRRLQRGRGRGRPRRPGPLRSGTRGAGRSAAHRCCHSSSPPRSADGRPRSLPRGAPRPGRIPARRDGGSTARAASSTASGSSR